jgi:hypothetical protein
MSIAFVYFLCYLLISSELLKSTNFKIMLKIRVHDSSAVTQLTKNLILQTIRTLLLLVTFPSVLRFVQRG